MASNLPSGHPGGAFPVPGALAAAEGQASITVAFTGARAHRAPLTWGQNGIWVKFQMDPDCDLNGSFVLTVQDEGISVAMAADAVSRKQREGKFNLFEEFHMRTGFVTAGGDVRFIILTFSNFAADGAAAQILMNELHLALSGREMPDDTVMQPSDLPRASIEGFLLGIEELLVRAAFHDVRITDIRPRSAAS